jgi:hypothetical protein
LSRQCYGRETLCIGQDLWYGSFGSCHVLKTESSTL